MLIVIPAIPGVICGHIARHTINSDKLPYKGIGLAITGLVLSDLSIVYGFIVINMLMQQSQ